MTRYESHVVALPLTFIYQMCYNVDDLLPLCEELQIPIVVSTLNDVLQLHAQRQKFDYHHDWIYVSCVCLVFEYQHQRLLAFYRTTGEAPSADKCNLAQERYSSEAASLFTTSWSSDGYGASCTCWSL